MYTLCDIFNHFMTTHNYVLQLNTYHIHYIRCETNFYSFEGIPSRLFIAISIN